MSFMYLFAMHLLIRSTIQCNLVLAVIISVSYIPN